MSSTPAEVCYHVNKTITVEQFSQLLSETTLGPRRPLDNPECLAGMLEHSDILVTAWAGERLIGIARSVTDFNYCCYLSDLAVSESVQKSGVGKALIQMTCRQLKPSCKVILLAAPLAQEYYPRLGFDQHPSAWTCTAESLI
ncbi:GNAT family N-acetyltransferase [Hafnia sp. CBA7124]|uniref:GNAT family N-acetyltransferase n=1 Tax=Hafnia sp. CBA7124 TaxID=1848580 RepID=UPI000BBB3176|nr:GNAT family N-acetyltransferase [Hafnia sp. CBA7124]